MEAGPPGNLRRRTPPSLLVAAAVVDAPGLARFFDQPHDGERRHRVDALGREQQVRDKAHHQRRDRQPIPDGQMEIPDRIDPR